MNAKQVQLVKIAEDILKSDPAPELRKQATQLVFGDGNPDADIVFIGEAPGKNEDIQGKPFVGVAGKFLNEMLVMIGLKREDVYITNIVKYRPPNNRDPLPEEKSVFLPFLEKQIDIINPKLIITLGRHSMDCLLPGLIISQVHGQPQRLKIEDRRLKNGTEAPEFKTQNRVIIPLFHPAAALYNGGLRQTLIDDFAKIPLILEKMILDLHKIPRFQIESARAKTVLSEGEVAIATSKEEKQFGAEIIRSGDVGALRKSSK